MHERLALDLFAGAGGATEGLRAAGFRIVGAIENERSAAQSYRMNHPRTRLWEDDIRSLRATDVRRELGLSPGDLSLLKACLPCQGFSSLAEGRADPDEARNDLVNHLIRFVRAFRPQAVLLENVPGLGRNPRSIALQESLRTLGYAVRQYRVNAVDYGVPQNRRRLIILAIRGRRTALPQNLAGPAIAVMSVRSAFERLASTVTDDDPLNVPRSVAPKVLARIQALPVGGRRFDLPAELQLACHSRLDTVSARAATSSYQRLKWDEPSGTMTTRCTTPACGPFIHPEANRGLTLREAATLQTFPATYQFAGKYGDIERQIGNAVPVKMAQVLGELVAGALDSRDKP